MANRIISVLVAHSTSSGEESIIEYSLGIPKGRTSSAYAKSIAEAIKGVLDVEREKVRHLTHEYEEVSTGEAKRRGELLIFDTCTKVLFLGGKAVGEVYSMEDEDRETMFGYFHYALDYGADCIEDEQGAVSGLKDDDKDYRCNL